MAAPVLVMSSPPPMTDSSSIQRATSKFPVHRPMTWPSFRGVHADGDEARPQPWPSFRGINGSECSGDTMMKPSRRCNYDSSPATTIGDVMEFQFPGYDVHIQMVFEKQRKLVTYELHPLWTPHVQANFQ